MADRVSDKMPSSNEPAMESAAAAQPGVDATANQPGMGAAASQLGAGAEACQPGVDAAAQPAGAASTQPSPATSVRRGPHKPSKRVVAPTCAVVGLLLVWQFVCMAGLVPNFMLPSPVEVVQALVKDFALLMSHLWTTLAEAAIGLAIGVAVGFAFAVLMDKFETFYLAFDPLLTVSQTVPTVAIAPLLVLWFGYGMLPKVLLVVLATFFPITVALAGGFRSVDQDEIDLLRTMNASEWQIFRYAELPAAAEQFFSGLRISATYAIVGAVISEWLGGFTGLGVYMTRVRKNFEYDRMFAVIIITSALSLALMKGVDALERLCMPWKRAEGNDKK